MSTKAFTIRFDSKKVRKLEQLASKLNRSRNFLVNQAIEQFLDVNTWQAERIKEGVKAADEGRFVGDAQMDRIFNKYKDPAQQRYQYRH